MKEQEFAGNLIVNETMKVTSTERGSYLLSLEIGLGDSVSWTQVKSNGETLSGEVKLLKDTDETSKNEIQVQATKCIPVEGAVGEKHKNRNNFSIKDAIVEKLLTPFLCLSIGGNTLFALLALGAGMLTVKRIFTEFNDSIANKLLWSLISVMLMLIPTIIYATIAIFAFIKFRMRHTCDINIVWSDMLCLWKISSGLTVFILIVTDIIRINISDAFLTLFF